MSRPAAPRAVEAETVTRKRSLFRRGPWENGSALVIGLGLCMLMQPFALELYTWSIVVILVGTVAFMVTSHFRD